MASWKFSNSSDAITCDDSPAMIRLYQLYSRALTPVACHTSWEDAIHLALKVNVVYSEALKATHSEVCRATPLDPITLNIHDLLGWKVLTPLLLLVDYWLIHKRFGNSRPFGPCQRGWTAPQTQRSRY